MTQNSQLGTLAQFVTANASANTIQFASALVVGNSSVNATINATSVSINSTATNTFTIGTSAYFVSNGNVGIGTSSPTAALHVNSNIAGGPVLISGNEFAGINLYTPTYAANGAYFGFDGAGGLAINNRENKAITISSNSVQRMAISSAGDVNIGGAAATPAGGLRYLDLYNTETTNVNSGTIMRIITANSTGGAAVTVDLVKYRYGAFNINNNDANGTINFGTTGTNRMTIAANGNIGIGTNAPTMLLQCGIGTAATTNYAWFTGNVGTGTAPAGTFGLMIGSNYSGGFSETNLIWGQGISSSQFFAIGKTTGSAYTEQMRITPAGAVYIGRTTSLGGTNVKFVVEQSAADWAMFIKNAGNNSGLGITNGSGTGSYTAINFYNNGETFSSCGSISVSGTTTTYATSSDYRLKKDTLPIQNAMSKIMKINPVTFKWVSDDTDGIGFIAHELQAIAPECVVGEKDDIDKKGKPKYQSVDASKLVATLTAALQELKREFDEYKASHP